MQLSRSFNSFQRHHKSTHQICALTATFPAGWILVVRHGNGWNNLSTEQEEVALQEQLCFCASLSRHARSVAARLRLTCWRTCHRTQCGRLKDMRSRLDSLPGPSASAAAGATGCCAFDASDAVLLPVDPHTRSCTPRLHACAPEALQAPAAFQ